MDLNSNFFKTLSIVADTLTLVTLFSAIPFALFKRNQNLLAFKISKFLHSLLRTGMMLFACLIILQISKLIYFCLILPFKGQIDDSNYYWENGKEWQHGLAYFISFSIGISIAWIICSFLWTSSWNQAKEFFNLFLPKNKLLPKLQSPLEILNAVYRTSYNQVDVTHVLRQMISNNSLTIKASNELAGDPHPGAVKTLVINYRMGNNNTEIEIREGETLTIP